MIKTQKTARAGNKTKRGRRGMGRVKKRIKKKRQRMKEGSKKDLMMDVKVMMTDSTNKRKKVVIFSL